MSDAENKPTEDSTQVEEMEEFEEEFEETLEEEENVDGVEFEFLDERETETPIDFERMDRAVAKILADAGVERGRMEIVVLDSEPMRETNVQFLGHDYPTDVLAFALEDDLENGLLEGNVLVCPDVAAERAPEFGWDAAEELLLYVIHGALHLVGYDDHSPEDAPTMRAKEREYLAFVGVEVPQTPDA
ncbi:MAG: rRNA maturation RNase YbeY [Thermoguttaceae bacterium]|nr:rRNA maturation RNase YbeY [Thermoguttaceae bacterium]